LALTSILLLASTVSVPLTCTSSLCICVAVEVRLVSSPLLVTDTVGALTRFPISVAPRTCNAAVAWNVPATWSVPPDTVMAASEVTLLTASDPVECVTVMPAVSMRTSSAGPGSRPML
jgi:hypothetical protein